MRKFAEDTGVSAARSRAEIETLLARYGATSFASGWDQAAVQILFEMEGRRIRFTIPSPNIEDYAEVTAWGRKTAEVRQRELLEQEQRRRWRALALVIKAKMEAVASKVSTFESEFLSHIILPGTNGKTVGEWMAPQIVISYESGKMPPMLPAPGRR